MVFPFTFSFTAAHFHLALEAASISHFVTAATKFSCCPSNKKNVSFVFSVALFHVELRWPAAYYSFSLSFSCSIFQICGHDN